MKTETPNLFKAALKPLFIFCALSVIIHSTAYSQQEKTDTLQFSALNKSKLSFILDDLYLFGGVTYSGLYFSNHFRNIGYLPGFVAGAEQLIPIKAKIFLSTGINVSQRNFMFRPLEGRISFQNLYLDIPMAASFEMPIFKKVDLRLMLGINTAFLMHSKIRGDYDAIEIANPDIFRYQTSDFHTVDFGWTFGASIEYKSFFFRVRSYMGFIKFDTKDQGMQNSFNLEAGYFLFRNIKKRK